MGYGKKKILKVFIEDDTERAVLMCFNQPWMENKLIPGNKYWVYGTFKYDYKEIQSSRYETEPYSTEAFLFNKIIPVYPLTLGLSQINARKYSLLFLDKYAKYIDNELPHEIMAKYDFLPKSEAIRAIHYPSCYTQLDRARDTLVYEELFYLQILVGKRVILREKEAQDLIGTDFTDGIYTPFQNRLLERLPFSLTEGQKKAVFAINRDLNRNTAMARLLQGDVGSGKTLVSFFAALSITEDGAQTAIMAPTELLARQHAETAARFLEPLGVRIAFLTGNVKASGRRELLKTLEAGDIDIAVGTHALFSKDVVYKKLKLVIIDEQHRFGVTQRQLIISKGENPALLMMSATPIPRTLALTVFGDMDVSVIKEMPPGRLPVKTYRSRLSNENKVYDFIKNELKKGRQTYFVYPLIDGGNIDEKEISLKDAVSMAQKLSNEIFPEYKTALIHSKLKEDEKRQIMDDFRKGKIKILSSTSVVEVGVDVPNASCMVIVHAERFGLSALHQLRGRVGRGVEQSYCFLVYSDDINEDGKLRLKIITENNDGFIIAEEDLKMRGPGQIAGTVQSGYLMLGIANPIRDIESLQRARVDAFLILKNDPYLILEDHLVINKVFEEAAPFSEITL